MPNHRPTRRKVLVAPQERIPRWSALAYFRMAQTNANYWRLSRSGKVLLFRWAYEATQKGTVTFAPSHMTYTEDRDGRLLVKQGWLKVVHVCCDRMCAVRVQITLPRGQPRERM